jgi:hypothetical protein
MENLDIFYDNLVNFTAIGNILGPFGIFCGHLVCIFCGHLVYFSPFWYFFREKSGNPATDDAERLDFISVGIYAI